MGLLNTILKGLLRLCDHAAANSGSVVSKHEEAYRRNPTEENAERLNKAYEYQAKMTEYQNRRNSSNNNY